VPEPRAVTEGLFRRAEGGPRLVAGRCGACERLHFPATTSCPYCGETGAGEATVGPRARLLLFTSIQTRPPGYRGPVPYGFGVVELEGGLRVVTRLTEHRMDQLAPDLPMTLVVEPLFTDDDGTPVLSYAFAPDAR
jgi:uncharacterized OB-fold protein